MVPLEQEVLKDLEETEDHQDNVDHQVAKVQLVLLVKLAQEDLLDQRAQLVREEDLD